MNRQLAIFALAATVAGSAAAQDRGRSEGNRGDGGRGEIVRSDRGNDAPRQDNRATPRQPEAQSAPVTQRTPPAAPGNSPAREPEMRWSRGQDSWRQQYQYSRPSGQQTQSTAQSQSGNATLYRGDAGRPDARRPDAGQQDTRLQDWGRQNPAGRDFERSGVGRPEPGRSDTVRSDAGRSNWGRSDWNRQNGGGQNWDDRGHDRREGNRDGRTWRYHGEDRDSYRVSAFRYPHGWGYRSWRIGERMPFLFLTNAYFLDEYDYGLPPAPYGYRWVRYGSDALLVNIYTGEVDDVIYGIFYW